jgi:hypothetical protein
MNPAYHFLQHYVYATLEHCAQCASRSYKAMIPLTAVLRMVTNVLVNLLHRYVCGIEISLGFVAVLEPCVVVAIHGSSRQQRLLTLQLLWPPTPTLNLLAAYQSSRDSVFSIHGIILATPHHITWQFSTWKTPRLAFVCSQVKSQASQVSLLALSTSPSKVSPVKSWLSTTPTNLQHHTFSSTQFHQSHNSSPRITSLSARDKSAAHHHQGTARRLPRATCHMVNR